MNSAQKKVMADPTGRTFAKMLDQEYSAVYFGESTVTCEMVWMTDRIAFVEDKHLLLHRCNMHLPIPDQEGFNFCGRVLSTNKCNRCGEDVDEAMVACAELSGIEIPDIDLTDYGMTTATKLDKLYMKKAPLYEGRTKKGKTYKHRQSFWR